MDISISFIRMFFMLLSVLFFGTYSVTATETGLTLWNLLTGVAAGAVFGLLLISSDTLFKRFNLRSFNVAIIGLFFGYLMGTALMAILSSAAELIQLGTQSGLFSLVRLIVYLFAAYVGMTMTARASEELHISIPFIRFKQTSHKKKDIIIDASILTDSRVIDLASSGLLDNHLILPRFIMKDLYSQSESDDEGVKGKARRSLEVIKKLEGLPNLDLRYADTDFPEIKEGMAKLIRLARFLDANIITADISRIQQSSIEGILIINIHTLSNALKPLTQTGEYINIKIQRYGKEARQGVGYLEDGTMVVVNGGAEYIGEVIKAQVLSVKHTSSGRMIFCNATEEALISDQESAQTVASLETSHKNYFAL